MFFFWVRTAPDTHLGPGSREFLRACAEVFSQTVFLQAAVLSQAPWQHVMWDKLAAEIVLVADGVFPQGRNPKLLALSLRNVEAGDFPVVS